MCQFISLATGVALVVLISKTRDGRVPRLRDSVKTFDSDQTLLRAAKFSSRAKGHRSVCAGGRTSSSLVVSGNTVLVCSVCRSASNLLQMRCEKAFVTVAVWTTSLVG